MTWGLLNVGNVFGQTVRVVEDTAKSSECLKLDRKMGRKRGNEVHESAPRSPCRHNALVTLGDAGQVNTNPAFGQNMPSKTPVDTHGELGNGMLHGHYSVSRWDRHTSAMSQCFVNHYCS